MATAFIGSEQHGASNELSGASTRTLRLTIRQLFGAGMLAASGYFSLIMFTGLWTASSLIRDYETLHGPLQIESGYWAHGNTPGSFVLCDQIDAAAGWLYPFGILAWFPVLALLWVGASLAFEKVRTITVVVVMVTAVIVAVATYFGGTTFDVLAILE